MHVLGVTDAMFTASDRGGAAAAVLARHVGLDQRERSAPPSTDLHEIQVAPQRRAVPVADLCVFCALRRRPRTCHRVLANSEEPRRAVSRVDWAQHACIVRDRAAAAASGARAAADDGAAPELGIRSSCARHCGIQGPAPRGGRQGLERRAVFAANGTSVTSVKLEGLTQDTAYEVRASVGAGPYSDSVVHRTASSSFDPLVVHRISENCGDECEPDLLYNHDTGSILADVEFITAMSRGGHFVQDFNASVTTRYCVHHERRPAYADYVSCNGNDTEHYDCYCNNWIDRCIGRLDTSVCNASVPDPQKMPACTCSDASLAESAKYLGRMPVYNPFPHHHHTSAAPPLPDCNVPPLGESTFWATGTACPPPPSAPRAAARAAAGNGARGSILCVAGSCSPRASTRARRWTPR